MRKLTNSKSGIFSSVSRFWKFAVLFTVIGVLSVCAVFVSLSNDVSEQVDLPFVVIRVDDIQDYAFREAQLFLLNHSVENKVPLSLAVIPKVFGEDKELVDAVKEAAFSGSEVAVHGWEHENLSEYTFSEQKLRLLEGIIVLEESLGVQVNVLVPPMFSYNDDTVKAMEETGCTVVSGLTEFHEPGWVSEKVFSVPATVELCDFSDSTWKMKSRSAVMSELQASIDEYGYVLIVTHPQEFIKGNVLDLEAAAKYEQIVQDISEAYSLGTIEDLSKALDLEK